MTTDDFVYVLETLAEGIPVTLSAVSGGIALTIVLSFAAGLALLSPSRTVRTISRVYVEGFRGTSEVVQLFWFYFSLPLIIGFGLLPLEAGILVLGLNHGAYGAEIVRGAVQSVPQAQHEGALALNFAPAQRMWRVILPQAVVEMLPTFNNLFIQLLKGSALLYFIDNHEIFFMGEELRPDPTVDVEVVYAIELLMYLVMAVVITVIMRWLEKMAAQRVGRSVPSRDKALAKVEGGVM